MIEREPNVANRSIVEVRAQQVSVSGLPLFGVATQCAIQRMRGDPGVLLPQPVVVVTAPAVVRGVRHHAGTHRVELDVTHAGEQVGFGVDQRRFVAAVPKRAGTPVGAVEVLDVAAAEGDQQLGDGVGSGGGDQQMDVVGHQHPRMQLAIGLAQGFAEPVQIGEEIVVADEASVAIVPALDDVQRDVVKVDAGTAGHGGMLVEPGPIFLRAGCRNSLQQKGARIDLTAGGTEGHTHARRQSAEVPVQRPE